MQRVPFLRRSLWDNFVNPRLAWRDYSFTSRTNYGAVVSGTTFDTIQSHIYYFGIWEPHVEAVIRQTLHPGDTFLDIGANIGYFTMLAARLVGSTGRVVSFEASATTLSKLRNNVQRNGMSDQVRLVHAAIADREGVLTLHSGPKDNNGMASLLRSEGATSEEVRSAPLGTFLSAEEKARVRLIKIDVEGAEGLVLEGMEPILPELYSSDFLVEIDPYLSSSRAILDRLARHGWRPYQIAYGDITELYCQQPPKITLPALTEPPTKVMDVLFKHESRIQAPK
jgi:FkbM family methyltransferase